MAERATDAILVLRFFTFFLPVETTYLPQISSNKEFILRFNGCLVISLLAIGVLILPLA